VHEVATTLRQRFEAAEVTIDLTQVAEHVVIDADRTQMGVLWEHLLRNAAESIRGSGRSGTVTVGLKYEQCGAISGIVRDDGPGFLTETDRRNAFNPFYSGRAAGRGLGFGLSLAWRVATAHRGVLVLESFVGGGLQASLSLPRSCEKVSTFATGPEADQ
ncbi:MAG: sensor histidine kinase, partial [Planctomycetaceae bacterium]